MGLMRCGLLRLRLYCTYFSTLGFDRIVFNLDIVLKWMKQNWISSFFYILVEGEI